MIFRKRLLKSLFLTLLLIAVAACISCIERVERTSRTLEDSLSAAPNYEMITYYLVLLRRGPNWTAEVTPEIEELQSQHLAHINLLADNGDLVLAGPFLEQTGDSALSGMFIFKVESLQAARELTESDPAVKAGRLVYEIIPWMGPSTLSY